MNILIMPFVNLLVGFGYLFGNMGWAVVAVTILIRLVLVPLVWPSMKMSGKMKEVQPKLKRLQEKYKDDKKKLAEAQMELYKQEGVNPMSGCLPQLLQVVVLIIFFSAFSMVTNFEEGRIGREEINKQLLPYFQVKDGFKFDEYFLGTKLSETPAKTVVSKSWAMALPLVLLLGSGLTQFLTSKMMMPQAKADEKLAESTKPKEDDMAAAMQTQMTYMMPLMTVFIGWNFSVGILLYWFVNSVFGLGQQIFVERMFDKKK